MKKRGSLIVCRAHAGVTNPRKPPVNGSQQVPSEIPNSSIPLSKWRPSFVRPRAQGGTRGKEEGTRGYIGVQRGGRLSQHWHDLSTSSPSRNHGGEFGSSLVTAEHSLHSSLSFVKELVIDTSFCIRQAIRT